MAHEIEINKNGTARVAWSDREIPWHKLGVPMKGLQQAEAMLEAAQAGFEVRLSEVAAVDMNGNLLRNPDGTPVVIEDSRATVRVNEDGSYDGLATVGTRFSVHQNREVLERALKIVGASDGDAVMDVVGVLDKGREFFATIDLGSLVIDPIGIKDTINRYLIVRNGHNGKIPITYANTDIRAVCKNTVRLGLKNASGIYKARHTPSSEVSVEDARIVLGMSADWADNFKVMAERMLSIQIPEGSNRLDRVINKVFPIKAVETERQQRNREEVSTLIRALYVNERNSATYGNNGWSAYNAVIEYLDHYRGGSSEERALTSMDDLSWVSRLKYKTQDAVLSLV
jgi:phage/plasmid-like protein (TIGR03299 family)